VAYAAMGLVRLEDTPSPGCKAVSRGYVTTSVTDSPVSSRFACSTEVPQPHRTWPVASNLYHPPQERKDLQRPCRHKLPIRRS